MSDITTTIDARNLLCPLPLIRLQDYVSRLSEATHIQIVATDPGVRQDIPMWCKLYGHEVLNIEEAASSHEIFVTIAIKK